MIEEAKNNNRNYYIAKSETILRKASSLSTKPHTGWEGGITTKNHSELLIYY